MMPHSRSIIVASVVALFGNAGVMADLLEVPAAYPTIQSAIQAAAAGDEVVVSPGVYFEHLNLLGKSITVRSTAPGDPETVAATVLDGASSGSIVTCFAGETTATVLDGLTLQHGESVEGAGVLILFSGLSVRRCLFRANHGDSRGAGIAVWVGDVVVEDCAFEFNDLCGVSCNGAGGAISLDGSTAEIRRCDFVGNRAGNGGGIAAFGGSDAVIEDCRFVGNAQISSFSANGGGGVFVWEAEAIIRRCAFLENDGNRGGGLFLRDAPFLIEDCSFIGNVGVIGGGVIMDAAGTMRRSFFAMNIATEQGGGVAAFPPLEGPSIIEDCVFVADESSGGGRSINCSGVGTVVLEDVVACGNNGDEVVGPFVDLKGNVLGGPCPPRLNPVGSLGGCCIAGVCVLATAEHCADADGAFFGPGTPCEACAPVPGDVTGDGVVTIDDLLALLAAWGRCP